MEHCCCVLAPCTRLAEGAGRCADISGEIREGSSRGAKRLGVVCGAAGRSAARALCTLHSALPQDVDDGVHSVWACACVRVWACACGAQRRACSLHAPLGAQDVQSVCVWRVWVSVLRGAGLCWACRSTCTTSRALTRAWATSCRSSGARWWRRARGPTRSCSSSSGSSSRRAGATAAAGSGAGGAAGREPRARTSSSSSSCRRWRCWWTACRSRTCASPSRCPVRARALLLRCALPSPSGSPARLAPLTLDTCLLRGPRRPAPRCALPPRPRACCHAVLALKRGCA